MKKDNEYLIFLFPNGYSVEFPEGIPVKNKYSLSEDGIFGYFNFAKTVSLFIYSVIYFIIYFGTGAITLIALGAENINIMLTINTILIYSLCVFAIVLIVNILSIKFGSVTSFSAIMLFLIIMNFGVAYFTNEK